MKNCMEKIERLAKRCIEGEVTMPKTKFLLISIICFLSGIICGLHSAPMTHGVMIGCNNGNSENYYEGEDGEKSNKATENTKA